MLTPQIHTEHTLLGMFPYLNVMCCVSELRDNKPVFEKMGLVCEEDMQMHSKFLDRKEELKAEHVSYLHQELRAMMADFLQFLFQRKPSNVFMFASKNFSPFAS